MHPLWFVLWYLNIFLSSLFPAVFFRTEGRCAVWLWAAAQQEAKILGTDCCSCIWSSFLLPEVWCHRPTLGWKSNAFQLLFYLISAVMADTCCVTFPFLSPHLNFVCLPAEDVWSVCASKVWGLVCHQGSAGVWRYDDGLWAGAACFSWLCAYQRGQDKATGGFQPSLAGTGPQHC